MNDQKVNKEFDFTKLWIILLLLFNLLLALGYWSLKNLNVSIFLIEHPIVILPYLIDSFGIFRILLAVLIVIGFIPLIIALPSTNKSKEPIVIRGARIIGNNKLKKIMVKTCILEIDEQLKIPQRKLFKSKIEAFVKEILERPKRRATAKKIYKREKDSYIHIGGIPMPRQLENRGFFFFGDPGTGKSQSIKQALSVIKNRPDFRGIIFDRNGEMLKQFYDPSKDLIYNPFDRRSADWCHTYEKGVRPETMAESLIPPPLPGETPYFKLAATVVVGEIFRKAKTNQQFYQMLTKADEEIKSDLQGTFAARYVAELKLASSVISTAINYCKFYRYVDKPKSNKISFYNWAYNDDPRWIFVTLKENDAAVLKPLHSMLFELMLKGLISNQNRKIKTAIIIDELGALNKLDSLRRLLNESRKFKGCPFLGTQTHAQIAEIYGDKETSILLQGTLVKLMLRCSDPDTAEKMSTLIGKREILRYKTNYSQTAATFSSPASKTKTVVEDYNESYAVLPADVGNREDMEGYLKTKKFTAQVQVKYQHYPDLHPDFVDIERSESESEEKSIDLDKKLETNELLDLVRRSKKETVR
ncbi:MAG: type IV secretion system DNA-binding domain-containing protein [Pleurocapsa sp. MO_226.B13]|nr:type IV secretion system DNA-binding domain-containing protein [Pleurocapsa sp. MO_226.B13]